MFTQGALYVPRNDTYESNSSPIFKFIVCKFGEQNRNQTYIPTNVCSLSPKSTPAFAVIFLFTITIDDYGKIKSCCSLNLHFSGT